MNSRCIFITGAAAGIGQAAARRFAGAGWFVGLYDVDLAGVERLAAELGPDRTLAGKLDVSNPEDWTLALDAFARRCGRLDVLLNNAGILASGPFESTPRERLQRIVDINFTGVINGCHAAFPYLRDTGGARVINMSSASAIYGQPELASYSATKFYVRGITEALDLEWGPHGIRVIAMWPLFVQTAMVSGVDTGTTRSLGVRLTAVDIARAVVEAVEPSRLRRALHQVHFAVGTQTKALSLGSRFSPAWLTRRVNRRLASH